MIFQMSCALSHQQITIQPSCEVSSYVQTIFRKMAHFPWSSHDFPMISPSKAPARGPRAAPARRTSWGFWGPDAGCCGRSQVGLQPIHWDLRNWGASKFEDFPSFGWCCDVMGVEYRIVCQLSLSVCFSHCLIYVHTFFAVLLNSCCVLSSKQSIGDTGYYQSWRWYCEYLTQTHL